MPSKKSKFYAQIHSPVSEAVIRVQFSKGDKVKELVEVALQKWGISSREGWFPALIVGWHAGYQLRLNDEIPTDPQVFYQEHESEFAYDWQIRRRGLKKYFKRYRQYGDIIRFAKLESSVTDSEETDVDWKNDDIHIALVTMITGG